MLRQDRNYQRMAQWISSKSARRWCMALLHSPDLHSAAASLRKHYFDTDGYAAWCGGVDLNMNGSYSGSQSQESWHRHVLRPSLEHMKRPVEQVIERLNLLVKSRHEQASLRLRSLEDCPARMWSRKLVAEGEAILQMLQFTFRCSWDRDTQYISKSSCRPHICTPNGPTWIWWNTWAVQKGSPSCSFELYWG